MAEETTVACEHWGKRARSCCQGMSKVFLATRGYIHTMIQTFKYKSEFEVLPLQSCGQHVSDQSLKYKPNHWKWAVQSKWRDGCWRNSSGNVMSCWLLGWFAHNNKGKVPAGRQRQREAIVCYCACARKLSLLGGAWCCRWHSPAYNDPASERSTVPSPPLSCLWLQCKHSTLPLLRVDSKYESKYSFKYPSTKMTPTFENLTGH